MSINNPNLFNVRIKNKYDTLDAWNSSKLVLEAGEIAIAYTTVDVTIGEGIVKQPALLMKVGDGSKTFADLPWLSAKAADVLSVCKSTSDLTNFVTNVVNSLGIASDEAMQALTTRVGTAEGAIDALEALVGTESVAKQITDALNGYATEAYANKAAKDAADAKDEAIAAAKKAGDDAQDTIDAYKTANDAALAAVKKTAEDATTVSEVNTQIDTKITALKNQDLWDAKGAAAAAQQAAATDATTKANAAQTAAEATAAADATSKANAAEAAAKAYADGLADNYDAAGAAATAEQNAKAYADSLAGNYDAKGSAATAEQNAKDYADEIKADLLGEGAISETYDTLKEIADWIETNGVDATELTSAIAEEANLRAAADTALSDRIKAYEDAKDTYATVEALNGVKATAEAAQTATQVSNAIDAKITALKGENLWDSKGAAAAAQEAAATDATNKANAAETNAKTHATNLNTAMNTRVEALEGIDHEAYKAADTTLHTTISGEIDALANGAVKTNTDAIAAIKDTSTGILAQAKKYTDDEIAELNIGQYAKQTALEATNTEVAKKANTADLADIAFSGSTDDLVQGTMTLVFDCGGSN